MAVSYTHLDVYKRQGLIDSEKAMVRFLNLITVSYTHLDVYKRQKLHACASAPS